MYSVCTRIEMIIFNKRGKRLPSPFYKLLLMCCVCCPEVLGAVEQGLGLPAQQAYPGEHHAAHQGTTERPQQRWGPLCSVRSASQLVSQAEVDTASRPCLNRRILLATQAAANEFSRSARWEASTKTSPKRDGLQEEMRRTRGFGSLSVHLAGLVRHQRGNESGAGVGQGGLGIPGDYWGWVTRRESHKSAEEMG